MMKTLQNVFELLSKQIRSSAKEEVALVIVSNIIFM